MPSAGSAGPAEEEVGHRAAECLDHLRHHHETLEFRKAAEAVRAIWRLGNGYLAVQAPWSVAKADPQRAAVIVRTGVNLIHAAALSAWPFIPTAAATVLESVGEASAAVSWPNDGKAILTLIPGGRPISVPPLLFRKITAADVTGPRGWECRDGN